MFISDIRIHEAATFDHIINFFNCVISVMRNLRTNLNLHDF